VKCLECQLKYIGETSRIFNIRYKEYIQVITKSNNNSRHSNLVFNSGCCISDIMDITQIIIIYVYIYIYNDGHEWSKHVVKLRESKN
jgi:hypothetical protein